MTFISRMEASVSTEMEVSQLPLREKPPPSEAKVAAERVDAVLDPYKKYKRISNKMEQQQQIVIIHYSVQSSLLRCLKVTSKDN